MIIKPLREKIKKFLSPETDPDFSLDMFSKLERPKLEFTELGIKQVRDGKAKDGYLHGLLRYRAITDGDKLKVNLWLTDKKSRNILATIVKMELDIKDSITIDDVIGAIKIELV